MRIPNRIAEALTLRRRTARQQAVATLAKPMLAKTDLAKLPDLLTAGELTADQADRLADLQREAEQHRVTIATGPARLAAVERAVGVLAEHKAETQAIEDKRNSMEQQLERELNEARNHHRLARMAEARLAEVEAEVEAIVGLAGPADLSEVSPVCIDNSARTCQSMPPTLDLPGAPEVIVTREALHTERERRRSVVESYDEATADKRNAAYEKAYGHWLGKSDEAYRDNRLASEKATRLGKPTPPPAHPDQPMPRPTVPTYADAVAAGEHKGTLDAA